MSESALRSYKGISPTLSDTVYVDSSAVVIGDVHLGRDCSIWPLVVVRGDVNKVRIGARTNIQDGTVIHETRPQPENPLGYPVLIGDDVTVGHKVMLHGCVIGSRVLVGMGAILLDGVIVEDEVIVGAGSLVTPGKRLRSGFLYTGSPARERRPLTESEKSHFLVSAKNYTELKNDYLGK